MVEIKTTVEIFDLESKKEVEKALERIIESEKRFNKNYDEIIKILRG